MNRRGTADVVRRAREAGIETIEVGAPGCSQFSGRLMLSWPCGFRSADNLLRCLSAMISWGVLRGWRADNPCLIVPKLGRSKPYPAWPSESIEVVREKGPQELWWATALALYSGQRQGDVLRMKWSDIRDGYMSVIQEKTDKPLQVLIHPSRLVTGPQRNPASIDLYPNELNVRAVDR